MGHIRIVKVASGKQAGLTILPGTFTTHKEALDSIKTSGEYLFLETHQVVKEKGKSIEEEQEPNE